MKIGAIIQARMSSTRLPGKVMADIAGKPLLEWVVRRTKQAKSVSLVMVATSDGPRDDVIERFCERTRTACFRGSEQDVLDRYYQSAKSFSPDAVVRITADCPLIDPMVIDTVVRVFQESNYDYVSNTIVPTYPDGLDTEVFSYRVLEHAWREARAKSEREHVTPFIWKHPELFRLRNVENHRNVSELRWTVDTPQDLGFVRRVYEYLDELPSFGMNKVLALLEEHPELKEINAGFERNEGYEKSLSEDSLACNKGIE
jgi:spore coat polysaccharide biosynthesis protein SpsF